MQTQLDALPAALLPKKSLYLGKLRKGRFVVDINSATSAHIIGQTFLSMDTMAYITDYDSYLATTTVRVTDQDARLVDTMPSIIDQDNSSRLTPCTTQSQHHGQVHVSQLPEKFLDTISNAVYVVPNSFDESPGNITNGVARVLS